MRIKIFILLFMSPAICWAGIPGNVDNLNLVIYKKKRQMKLYSGTKLIKTYSVGLGLNPVSPKEKQGDYATPEGEYQICGKLPKSTYYMALILNYPNIVDADRGVKEGLISKKEHAEIVHAIKKKKCPNFFTKLGGQIEIHGMGSQSDWTWGCIALDNPDIEELYKALPNGTTVKIKP